MGAWFGLLWHTHITIEQAKYLTYRLVEASSSPEPFFNRVVLASQSLPIAARIQKTELRWPLSVLLWGWHNWTANNFKYHFSFSWWRTVIKPRRNSLELGSALISWDAQERLYRLALCSLMLLFKWSACLTLQGLRRETPWMELHAVGKYCRPMGSSCLEIPRLPLAWFASRSSLGQQHIWYIDPGGTWMDSTKLQIFFALFCTDYD